LGWLFGVVVLASAVAVAALSSLEFMLERVLAGVVVGLATAEISGLIAGGMLRDFTPGRLALAAFIGGTALVVAVSVGPGDRQRLPRADATRAPVGRIAAVLALLVAGAQLAWRAVLAFRLPAVDWDGLYYHLLSVGTWLRDGRITGTPQVLFSDTYPKNAELLMTVVATIDHNSLRLVDGVSLIALPLGLLAVACTARWIGLSTSWAIVTGVGFCLTPVVLAQATTTYVDSLTAASVLAGWYFLASGLPVGAVSIRLSRHRLALSGLALGLAAGMKASAVLPAGLAAAIAMFSIIDAEGNGRLGQGSSATGRTMSLLGPFFVPLLALGAPWYVWNLVRFGNPTHPFDFGLGPLVLFRGIGGPAAGVLEAQKPEVVQDSGGLLGALRIWASEPASLYGYDSYPGLGAQWSFVLMPSLAIALWRGLLRPVEDRVRQITWSYLLPIALVSIATPGLWWSRFSTPLVAAGLIAFSLNTHQLWNRRPSLWTRAFVMSAIVALSALVGWGAWVATKSHLLHTQRLTFTELADIALGTSKSPMPESSRWAEHMFASQLPAGTVIALSDSATDHSFSLLGTDLQNLVEAVPAQPRSDAQALLEALDAIPHADYFVTRDNAPDFALAEESDRLKRVAHEYGLATYRIEAR
jgi:hypothetical protein